MATTFDTVVTINHQNAGGTLTQQRTYQTETLQPLKITLTASQANKRIQFAIPDPTKIKTLAIKTPNDIDIYTNDASSGSPDQHLVIAAAVGLEYDSSSGYECPITDPVTDLYVTNAQAVAVPASAGAAVIEILISFDPSP